MPDIVLDPDNTYSRMIRCISGGMDKNFDCVWLIMIGESDDCEFPSPGLLGDSGGLSTTHSSSIVSNTESSTGKTRK